MLKLKLDFALILMKLMILPDNFLLKFNHVESLFRLQEDC